MIRGIYDNYGQQQWTKGIELGLIVWRELFDVKHFNNIVEQNYSTNKLKIILIIYSTLLSK